MNQGTVRASELDAALRRVRRGVLATLAVSAVVIATTAASGPVPAPPVGFPIAAIALGLGECLRTPRLRSRRLRAHGSPLALASLLLPAGVGLVGVALALQGRTAQHGARLRPRRRAALPPPGRASRSAMRWERTRSFFPVTQTLAYLNHAGVAPISTRVAEALARYSAEATHRGAFDYARAYDAEIERVRGRAAELIGASRDEIAFVKNTSEGLGLVAAGLDWQRGDRVVICDLEYPSNVYAWWSLRPRGVETVMLRGRDGALPHRERRRGAGATRAPACSRSPRSSSAAARATICRRSGACAASAACSSASTPSRASAASRSTSRRATSTSWRPTATSGCSRSRAAASSSAGARWSSGSRRAWSAGAASRTTWTSIATTSSFSPAAGRFEEGTPNTAGHLRARRRDRPAARARHRGHRRARARAQRTGSAQRSRSAAPRSRARVRPDRPRGSSPSDCRTRRPRARRRGCARRAYSSSSVAAACAHRPTSTTRPRTSTA